MSQQFTGDHMETGRKTTQDRENALRQVITDYQGYVNAGDVPGYVTLFTDDVIWMPPNAPDRIGKADVFTAQGTTFSKFKLSVELTPTEVRLLSEDYGLVLASVHGSLTPHAGGDAADIRFRALFIMASQPDGTWRITRQMWNNKPN